MPKMYAWSNFPLEVDEWGQTRKMLKCGEEVTQTKLGVDKETWDSYVERGIVSAEPYPDIADDVSPAEHERAQINAQAVMSEAEERLEFLNLEAPSEPPSDSE